MLFLNEQAAPHSTVQCGAALHCDVDKTLFEKKAVLVIYYLKKVLQCPGRLDVRKKRVVIHVFWFKKTVIFLCYIQFSERT